MPRYKPSDDGTVVDGSIVVYMRGPQSTVLVERSGRAALARATVASLVAAAETGVAPCGEVDDRTRKAIRAFQLAHKLGETAELDTATSRRIDLAYKGL